MRIMIRMEDNLTHFYRNALRLMVVSLNRYNCTCFYNAEVAIVVYDVAAGLNATVNEIYSGKY